MKNRSQREKLLDAVLNEESYAEFRAQLYGRGLSELRGRRRRAARTQVLALAACLALLLVLVFVFAPATRLPADGEEAGRIVARARSGSAAIESIEAETQRMPPPPLYDLTELQRHANRLFGFSAQKTLDVAQALYEKRKLISYPRTDSRHLSQDVAATLPQIVRTIAAPFRDRLAPGVTRLPTALTR